MAAAATPAEDLRSRRLLALAIVVYVAVFSFLCYRRVFSGALGDPDYGLFDQGFYTTLKFGTPFVNTFEGHSSFGNHVTPIFYLLLPVYAIHPGLDTLVFLQSVLLGLAAWPFYLIARPRLGPRAALGVALLYLAYHPLHGVNYDQFNPNSLAVLPLMLALHFFLERRWRWFWVCVTLALLAKEDVSFVIAFWGLFALAAAVRGWWRDGTAGWLPLHGAAMVAIGVGWLATCLYVIVPFFRGGEPYDYFNERYPHLGSNLVEALTTIVLHPFQVAEFLLQRSRVSYVLEVFLPAAFVPLRAPGLLWMTVPVFGTNTLSMVGMHTTGDRYTAYIIPFLFVAAVTALARMDETRRRRSLRWMAALTILGTVFLSNTPLRVGRGPLPITDHQRRVAAMAKSIPPDASVATQVGLYNLVSHRVHAYARYREGVEYIFVDPTSKWYLEYAHWDEQLPPLLSRGRYVKIREDDGIELYRRVP